MVTTNEESTKPLVYLNKRTSRDSWRKVNHLSHRSPFVQSPKVNNLPEEIKSILRRVLSRGESVVETHNCADAFFSRNQTKLVLTSHRILAFKQTVESPLISLSWQDIEDIEYTKSFGQRKLVIQTTEDFTVKWDLNFLTGDFFVEKLRDQWHPRPSTQFNTQKDMSLLEANDPSMTDDVSVSVLSKSELVTRLQKLDEYEFEHFIADLWAVRGWKTSVSQQSIDAGIDVVATKEMPYSQKKVIQAKRYGENTTVGGPDIQQYASLKHQVPDTDAVIVVTTGSFSQAAKERAKDLNVKTINGIGLISMIDQADAFDIVAEYLDIPLESKDTTEPNQQSQSDHLELEFSAGSSRISPKDVPEYEDNYDISEEQKERLTTDIRITNKSKLAEIVGEDVESYLSFNTHSEATTIHVKPSLRKWQYVIITLGLIYYTGIFGDIPSLSALVGISLLLPTYLDIRNIREAEIAWDPSIAAYLTGMAFIGFITIPIYIIQRYRAIGI